MESIETTGKGGDEKRKWHTGSKSRRKGEQSREKSTAFCNEPCLRSSTILSVGFHFVSMPLCIFSFSPCAVIMLSCRTSWKKKFFGSHSRWLCSLPISDIQIQNVHRVPTFPFVDSLCCLFSIRGFESTRQHGAQKYTTAPLHTLYPDANRLGFTVSTLRWVCSPLRVVSG